MPGWAALVARPGDGGCPVPAQPSRAIASTVPACPVLWVQVRPTVIGCTRCEAQSIQRAVTLSALPIGGVLSLCPSTPPRHDCPTRRIDRTRASASAPHWKCRARADKAQQLPRRALLDQRWRPCHVEPSAAGSRSWACLIPSHALTTSPYAAPPRHAVHACAAPSETRDILPTTNSNPRGRVSDLVWAATARCCCCCCCDALPRHWQATPILSGQSS